MKFSRLAITAAASVAALVAPATNAEKDFMSLAIWCCLDSDENCADACAFINDCANQEELGQGTDLGFPPPGVAIVDERFPCIHYTLGNGISADPTMFDVFGFGIMATEDVPPACRDMGLFQCCDAFDGYGCGDPHFQTWGGVTFDYHGECDLNFLSAPQFAHGLGLDIHVRTKIRFDYSYISNAAIKIGDSVIEIAGWGEYIVDGVESAEMPTTLGDGIPITHEAKDKNKHVFRIDVSKVSNHGDAMIKVQTFKDWVSIHIEHPSKKDYANSVGMLGSFPEGKRLGRDGVTVLEDDNAYGQQWQVLPEDGSLFQSTRAPQHPSQCILPHKKASTESRRLAGVEISEEEAREACAHQETHVEFCVRDVLATQDLEMAAAGAF